MSGESDVMIRAVQQEVKERGHFELGLDHLTRLLLPTRTGMQNVTVALRTLSIAGRRSLTTSAPRLEQQAEQAVASTSAAWTPQTQRTGVLARKLGMTALWQEGIRVPVTVLHVSPCRAQNLASSP